MKNLGILVVLLVVLLVAGGISAGLLPKPPVIVQTQDPNGSVMMVTPEQANQLVFWVIFVLVNLIGAGTTIAVLVWFGSRAVTNAKAMPLPIRGTANPSEELPEKAS